MLRNVYLKTLRDARRATMWWTIGLVAMAAWVAGLYPSYEKVAADMQKFFDEAPAAMRVFFGGELNIGTPEGFFNTELFSFMVPLLLIILAVGHGQRALAGEEKRGTLDLLLASPISRRRLVLDKAAAMTTAVLWASVVLAAALVIAVLITGIDLSLLRLVQASFAAGMLAVAFGAIALAVGAATGSTGAAIGVTSAIGLGTYLLNGLAQLIDVLEPYRYLSPFYYYAEGTPLLYGPTWMHIGVLGGIAAAGIAASLVTFERRDLAV